MTGILQVTFNCKQNFDILIQILLTFVPKIHLAIHRHWFKKSLSPKCVKPLPEPTMTQFCDGYMRHQASGSWYTASLPSKKDTLPYIVWIVTINIEDRHSNLLSKQHKTVGVMTFSVSFRNRFVDNTQLWNLRNIRQCSSNARSRYNTVNVLPNARSRRPTPRPCGRIMWYHFNGLMQKRRNSIALAMELRLFCIKPSIHEFRVNSVFCHSMLFMQHRFLIYILRKNNCLTLRRTFRALHAHYFWIQLDLRLSTGRIQRHLSDQLLMILRHCSYLQFDNDPTLFMWYIC